jgi:hypothetical protein
MKWLVLRTQAKDEMKYSRDFSHQAPNANAGHGPNKPSPSALVRNST